VGNEAQGRFVSDLNWMDARSKSEFGREFMECTPEQQKSLLEELAYKANSSRRLKVGGNSFKWCGLHGGRLLHDKGGT